MDSFIFKGVSSTSFNIIVNSLPPITKPPLKVEEISIDGVDGTRYEELGYESYEKAIKITLKENNIDELISWLNGEGNLILSNEQDKYYNAKIINQIDFERLIKFQPVEIVFKVQPYKYSITEVAIESETETSFIVTNSGNEKAKPIITLRGTGNIVFYLDSNLIFQYTFDDSGEVVIDSEKQDAYLGNVLKNRNMIGEFPIFQVGDNEVIVEGDITYLKIENRSRWL